MTQDRDSVYPDPIDPGKEYPLGEFFELTTTKRGKIFEKIASAYLYEALKRARFIILPDPVKTEYLREVEPGSERVSNGEESFVWGPDAAFKFWSGYRVFLEVKSGSDYPRKNQREVMQNLASQDDCAVFLCQAEIDKRWALYDRDATGLKMEYRNLSEDGEWVEPGAQPKEIISEFEPNDQQIPPE